MSTDTAQRVLQLSDYAVRLAAARDRSYKLARDVEKSQGTLNVVAQDPASDVAVCECAARALESLCENLVRLCSLTDQASANAEALASLPLKFFSDHSGAAAELDAAVLSLADATETADAQLAELAQVVAEACEAVDEMQRPVRIG
jgi:methyl-accepting chemotaxis protein